MSRLKINTLNEFIAGFNGEFVTLVAMEAGERSSKSLSLVTFSDYRRPKWRVTDNRAKKNGTKDFRYGLKKQAVDHYNSI